MTLTQIDKSKAKELTDLLHRTYAPDRKKYKLNFKAATISEDEVIQHLKTTPTFAILTDDNRIIATASVRLPWSNNPSPYNLPHLGWIATDPDYKQRGYAKKIINQVINEYIVNQLRSPAVSIGTAKEHPWLVDFYQSLGFNYLEETKLFSDHTTVYLKKNLEDLNYGI